VEPLEKLKELFFDEVAIINARFVEDGTAVIRRALEVSLPDVFGSIFDRFFLRVPGGGILERLFVLEDILDVLDDWMSGIRTAALRVLVRAPTVFASHSARFTSRVLTLEQALDWAAKGIIDNALPGAGNPLPPNVATFANTIGSTIKRSGVYDLITGKKTLAKFLNSRLTKLIWVTLPLRALRLLGMFVWVVQVIFTIETLVRMLKAIPDLEKRSLSQGKARQRIQTTAGPMLIRIPHD